MRLLPKLGAELRVVGPPALLPADEALLGIPAFTDFDEAIEGADVVMMLRIQRERMEAALSASLDDFHGRYGLTRDRLARAAPDALVMHPGPMNRGVEIDGELADDRSRSAILDQVEIGVAVRMACLDILTRERRTE
jgi:aspartate carbamoyltransferase catalytic subunit